MQQGRDDSLIIAMEEASDEAAGPAVGTGPFAR